MPTTVSTAGDGGDPSAVTSSSFRTFATQFGPVTWRQISVRASNLETDIPRVSVVLPAIGLVLRKTFRLNRPSAVSSGSIISARSTIR